jgi:hypothetical protein
MAVYGSESGPATAPCAIPDSPGGPSRSSQKLRASSGSGTDSFLSDIRLVCAGLWPLRAILSASSGTTFRPDDESGTLSYLEDAAVPFGDWRELTSEELDQLLHPRERSDFHVGLVRIDRVVWESFEELRAILAATPLLESARAIVGSERWHGLISRAVQSVMRWTPDGAGSFAGVGLCVHPPGLPTVTYDEPRQGLIGLHVDSWYGDLPPQSAPGRISVNLGYAARHSLFSPLSLPGMETAMQADATGLNRRGNLARGYFRKFPDQSVLRLRVAPGEAYIAPTESISHDGSTQDQTGWDLTLTVRSRFLADLIEVQQGGPQS